MKKQYKNHTNYKTNQKKPLNRFMETAFTVVELVIVISVIALLTTVSYAAYGGWQKTVAEGNVKSDLSQVLGAMKSSKNFSKDGFPVIAANTNFDGSTATKDIFQSSPEVDLKYIFGTDDYYCVEATSKSVAGVSFFLNFPTSHSPAEGNCPAPPVPPVPPTPPTVPTPPSGPSTIADNFNRTVAGIGNTSTGNIPWQVLSGTWEADGTTASLSANSPTASPLAVVEAGSGNVDASVDLQRDDALYFRVKDSDDWWRAKQDRRTITTTTTTYEPYIYNTYTWQPGSWSYQGATCENGTIFPSSGTYYSGSSNGYSTFRQDHMGLGSGGCGPVFDTRPAYDDCNGGTGCGFQIKLYSRTVNQVITPQTGYHWVTNTTTSYRYDFVLEKMVAGTLSEVWRQNGPATLQGSVRVVANGSAINLYTGSTGLVTINDSFNQTMTRHGIGRAVNTVNPSVIDNFNLGVL